jgi:RNA polymerase sigma-70 factor (ECF subfamily)
MQIDSVRQNEAFVRLYACHQQDIYRYVLAMVPNTADASDVVQETAVSLWGKMSLYDANQPFLPWALSFAHFEVRKFRAKQQRRNRKVIQLSDETVELLAQERKSIEHVLEERRQALAVCLEKLTAEERHLIEQRYGVQATVREVAEGVGAGVHTLYRKLRQIRHKLTNCVTRIVLAGRTQ